MTSSSDKDLYFELLNLIDELLGFRNRLDNLLKSAFFELSTTKYQIGAENVTRLQYDNRMKSEWKVEHLKDGQVTTTRKSTGDTPDPVEWFGILAPQSLRNAQGKFITAVDVLVEIAKLISQIKKVESEIVSRKALL